MGRENGVAESWTILREAGAKFHFLAPNTSLDRFPRGRGQAMIFKAGTVVASLADEKGVITEIFHGGNGLIAAYIYFNGGEWAICPVEELPFRFQLK